MAGNIAAAKDLACRWLSYRSRTEAEVRKKLLANSYDPSVVDEVIRWLLEYRYLNDRGIAETLVETLRRRGLVSKAMLQRRLLTRGIDPALAKEVTTEALEGIDESAEAMALAEKKMKTLARLPPDTARRRLAGFLSRRGFSADSIYKVLDRIS